jgi:UDP-N-acetylglucosamine--N-acetylmuramyl-(pentapeptide) pyrophosphoryl-undecaprenol N-acetylglucosamine transferase
MAAGASGGHVFPALATAEALRDRGTETVFVLGGSKFNQVIVDAGFEVENLPASAWAGKGVLAKLGTIITLVKAFIKAQAIIKKHNPVAAFGTGGYATVALVLAAKKAGVKTVIHEQNLVPGRANTFLAKYADVIAVSFEGVKNKFGEFASKVVVTGNPLRKAIIAKATAIEPELPPFNLMVLGGSLGAQFLSTLIPAALGQLSEGKLVKLHVTHQARPENVNAVRTAYKNLGIQNVEVQSFFDDLPDRLTQTHLVISRAGASAITEFALFGRASILIPHRLADHHQLANAKVLADANAAILLEQQACTAETLGATLRELIENDAKRHEIAKNAHKFARPTAAVETAERIITLAGIERG